eukprot:9271996-Ditylum_brightwellii.AAC.2
MTLDAMRRKHSFSSDLFDTNIFNGVFAHTPTDERERQNVEHNEVVEVNLNQAGVDLDDDVDGDLFKSHFQSLYDGGNDIDRFEGYDEKYETWLDD